MKVLYLCPWVPWPLTNGGRTRTYHLLRETARRAEVHLRVVRDPDTAPDAAEALGALGASFAMLERTPAAPLGRLARPKLERWFHSAPLRAAVAEALVPGHFDVVHLDEMFLARALPPDPRAAVVVHHHKLDTVLYDALEAGGGPGQRFDAWKLRRLERYALTRFRHHLLCSAEDVAILRGRYGDRNYGVVPSGYDQESYPACAPPRAREPKQLLFLGSMDYGPNVDGVEWFVRECLPPLRERHPTLRLDIVGRNPLPAVRALEGSGVHVVGEVPEVKSHLERCAVFVVPLRIGGGTRLKLVEALGVGAPTVSTTIGAEGLGLRHGEHLLLADDPAAQVEAIHQLLIDPTRAATLGESGHRFVHSRYTWAILAERLVEYWRGAAASP